MADFDTLRWDATGMAGLIRSRKVSPVEVMAAHLDRIARLNPALNAIVAIDGERAMTAAREAERASGTADALRPLHGVPFTAKDALDSAGVPTRRGSRLFDGRVPDVDATSIARLKRAGAILIGKTNLPEFAFWTETDNPLSGRTNNPWNVDHTPGGSSGGESAAIAAGLSAIGVGSDVGISVRGPAALTGIVALKPTHGRIPATGHWPAEPRRYWHIGPMARSVRDVALGYALMAGPDGKDGHARFPATFDAGIGATPDRQIRVGWVTDALGPVASEVAAVVADAAAVLRMLGCAVEQVRLDAMAGVDPIALSGILFGAEVKPVFTKVVGDRRDMVADTVRAVLNGPDAGSEDYVAAQSAVERMSDGFARYFERYDVLLCPVTPVAAPCHARDELDIDGRAMPARHILSATVPFNLTGLPAMTLRFGTSREGLPIGIQLVSRWFAESTILGIADRLEAARPAMTLRPPV